jgi:hypothetical protein
MNRDEQLPRPVTPRSARPRPAPAALRAEAEAAHQRASQSKVPVVRAPRPAQAAHSEPRVRAASPRAAEAPVPAPRAPSPARALVPVTAARAPEKAYVAVEVLEAEELQPLQAHYFESLKAVAARTAVGQELPKAARAQPLSRQRGYDKDDLMTIAEVAWHYLMNGGTMLALTLFEGLEAVAPDQPYFALALGLTQDHLGDRTAAHRWYRRASELDPGDPRPDINAAELFLADKKTGAAIELLARAVHKAEARGDEALRRKAAAILAHVSRAA